MKITISFKTPDAVDNAIDEEYPDTEENEDSRRELREFFQRYVKWGECVSIEFDTEAGTARVLSTRN